MDARIERTAFSTSRQMEFLSDKELAAQTGHGRKDWPLVILKELLDNALDACEEVGTPPVVSVSVDRDGITVTDNGPGIPGTVVEGVCDFSRRVSSREAYVAPDRGAQGNALKTMLAIPFVLDGESGRVDIVARGTHHEVNLKKDPILQEAVVDHRPHSLGGTKGGTKFEVRWPNSPEIDPSERDSACSILLDSKERFLQIADDFTFANPHLTLTVDWHGERHDVPAATRDWSKWRPSEPSVPAWYDGDRFERLILAHIARDRDEGMDSTVREFVSQFRGLSGSAKQKKVLDASGLARVALSEFVIGDSVDHERIHRLLAAMQEHSKPVSPAKLGVIGKEHIANRFSAIRCEMDSFRYAKKSGEEDGVPWLFEAAFAWCPGLTDDRRIVRGINWSPCINNPLRDLGNNHDDLEGLLADQRCGAWETEVALFLHLVHPRVEFADRGKSVIVISESVGAAISDAIRTVTKKWAKQRKQEERQSDARWRRKSVLLRQQKVTLKDTAYAVMEDAYMKASSDNTLPAHARQIMYAARGRILELTGESHFKDSYFTQNLLPDFMAENPELTAGWKVAFDPRGNFHEPHTGVKVPLGTLPVEEYISSLDCIGGEFQRLQLPACGLFPTRGPRNRIQAILFLEKEGFMPLLDSVKLAERYDLAVMSTKGLSVTASRSLVDKLCGRYGIPLLVLHDFDLAGFSIVGTLSRSARRYTFVHDINVIDLGLRLADVQTYSLESEAVKVSGSPEKNRNTLVRNGASREEADFLLNNRRVELKAFASGDFIQ